MDKNPFESIKNAEKQFEEKIETAKKRVNDMLIALDEELDGIKKENSVKLNEFIKVTDEKFKNEYEEKIKKLQQEIKLHKEKIEKGFQEKKEKILKEMIEELTKNGN